MSASKPHRQPFNPQGEIAAVELNFFLQRYNMYATRIATTLNQDGHTQVEVHANWKDTKTEINHIPFYLYIPVRNWLAYELQLPLFEFHPDLLKEDTYKVIRNTIQADVYKALTELYSPSSLILDGHNGIDQVQFKLEGGYVSVEGVFDTYQEVAVRVTIEVVDLFQVLPRIVQNNLNGGFQLPIFGTPFVSDTLFLMGLPKNWVLKITGNNAGEIIFHFPVDISKSKIPSYKIKVSRGLLAILLTVLKRQWEQQLHHTAA